jgi:hypothetical protein
VHEVTVNIVDERTVEVHSPVTQVVEVLNARGPKGDPGEPGRDGIDGIDGIDGQDGRDGVDGSAVVDISRISYTHIQSASSDEWAITHNLGFAPSLTLFDSAGSQLEADVEYPDSNTVVVHLSVPLTGAAYLS